MKFDEFLTNDHLGQFGKYQKIVCIKTCLPSIWGAMIVYSWTFTGRNIAHRCVQKDFKNFNFFFANLHLTFTGAVWTRTTHSSTFQNM